MSKPLESSRPQVTLAVTVLALVALLGWRVGEVAPEVRGEAVPTVAVFAAGTVADTVAVPDSPTARVESGTAYSPPERLEAVQVTDTLPPPTTTTLPGWTGEIPSYRPGGACTQTEADIVARKFRAAGASDDTVWWALRTFSRESNCDESQHNYNTTTRDDSYSLCMMNARAGHFGSNGILAGVDRYRTLVDFGYAVDACVTLWQACGRGPWNSGNYYCTEPTS